MLPCFISTLTLMICKYCKHAAICRSLITDLLPCDSSQFTNKVRCAHSQATHQSCVASDTLRNATRRHHDARHAAGQHVQANGRHFDEVSRDERHQANANYQSTLQGLRRVVTSAHVRTSLVRSRVVCSNCTIIFAIAAFVHALVTVMLSSCAH